MGGSAHTPEFMPPAKDAPIKEWFKKFFCLSAAVAKSNQKIKKRQAVIERRQEQQDDKLDYLLRHSAGGTSAPYQPREWPPLEVSDDFAREPEIEQEEEEDDAES